MSRHVIKILQLHHPNRLCESEAWKFSCAISDLGSKCSYLLYYIFAVLSIKMWLASILIINTLTMLTIGHADRGRPTLKDDERFRNGYFHDLKIGTLMRTQFYVKTLEQSYAKSLKQSYAKLSFQLHYYFNYITAIGFANLSRANLHAPIGNRSSDISLSHIF